MVTGCLARTRLECQAPGWAPSLGGSIPSYQAVRKQLDSECVGNGERWLILREFVLLVGVFQFKEKLDKTLLSEREKMRKLKKARFHLYVEINFLN